MAYSNTDKAKIIANSFGSQFTLNHNVVIPRMVNIVNTQVEHSLKTEHNNTLNPKLPYEVSLKLRI